MSLQRRDLVPPSIPLLGYWALLVFPSERSERSNVGESDDSIILDLKWAQLMTHVWEGLHVKNDGRSIWNFTCPALVKEIQISFKRLGVQVVPHQRHDSRARHDNTVEARPLLVIQKRRQWKSAKSLVWYEKSARLGQDYAQYPNLLRTWIGPVSLHVEGAVLGLLRASSLPPCA